MAIKLSTAFLIALLTISILLNPSSAKAVEMRPYITGNAQYLFSDTSNNDDWSDGSPNGLLNAIERQNNNNGYALGTGLGVEFNRKIRLEAEFSYKHNEVESIQIATTTTHPSGINTSVYAYMGNAYYDFRNSTAFTPYIGLGFGSAHIEYYDSTDLSPQEYDDVASQLMLGVGYQVNENQTAYLGYRSFGIGAFFPLMDYSKDSIEAGYRYTF